MRGREEQRKWTAKQLSEMAVAGLLILGMIPARYPFWAVLAVVVTGCVSFGVERRTHVRRGFWIAICASYLTLVTYTLFPYPWLFRWFCCFAMTGVIVSLYSWAIEK